MYDRIAYTMIVNLHIELCMLSINTDKPALITSITLGTILVVCLTLLGVSIAVAVTESKAKARIRTKLETVMRDQSLQTSHINTDENIAYGRIGDATKLQ